MKTRINLAAVPARRSEFFLLAPVVLAALVSGSPEWHEHRGRHFNASDAPAMMNCSPHESRLQLLTRLAAGDDGAGRVISAWATENVIDPGHAFEAHARGLVERLLDDDLIRPVIARGPLSASLDGRSLGAIDWEHKRLNDTLRQVLPPAGFDTILGPEFGRMLPLMYRVQIAHQQFCSGAARTLFTASEWTHDGDVVDHRHCWVERDDELIGAVLDGWIELARDLRTFEPVEVADEVVDAAPAAAPALPALALAQIQTEGAIVVRSNLKDLLPQARAYVAAIPQKPSTEAEFKLCRQAVARLKEIEEKMDAAVEAALQTIPDIAEMQAVAATFRDIIRPARLSTSTMIDRRARDVRAEIVEAARGSVVAFMAELNASIAPDRLQPIDVDWPALIKGMSSVDSMRSAVDTKAAAVRAQHSAAAERVMANADIIEAADMPALFTDRASLVHKDTDAVRAIVALRVNEEIDRRRKLQEEAAAAALAATPAPTAAPTPAPTPAPNAVPAPTPAPPAGDATAGALLGVVQPIQPAAALAQAPAGSGPVATRTLSSLCDAFGWRMTAAEVTTVSGVETFKPAGKAGAPILLRVADVAVLKAAMKRRIDEA